MIPPARRQAGCQALRACRTGVPDKPAPVLGDGAPLGGLSSTMEPHLKAMGLTAPAVRGSVKVLAPSVCFVSAFSPVDVCGRCPAQQLGVQMGSGLRVRL